MKIQTQLLALLFLAAPLALAEPQKTNVAKIDYSEIDDLLIEVVLSHKGNEDLRERYYTKKKAEADAHKRMQESIMKGEGFDPRDAAKAGFMPDDPDKVKVEQLCQKHMLELIEKAFEGKYQLVFKDDYRSSLIYSRVAIDDVTIIVKQSLLKSMPE